MNRSARSALRRNRMAVRASLRRGLQRVLRDVLRKGARWWLASSVGLAAAGAGEAEAEASVVERIVAVVGDRAILLSELRRRAQPEERQLLRNVADADARAVALPALHRQVLERMIDDQLEAELAARRGVSVTPAEVERAVELQARQNDMSVERLYEEVLASGLTPNDYREELRRQLLAAKLAQLNGVRAPNIGEVEPRRAYRQLELDERRTLAFRAAALRFELPPERDRAEARRMRQLAGEVAARARAGDDFAGLARAYASDERTRERGGALDATRPGQLPAPIDAALLGLAPGESTGPVAVAGELWVLSLIERAASSLPPFEAARAQLRQRVAAERFVAQRRQWLDGLRRQAHVEIRF
ncbi:MAG TPA: SurA N-terminal domain-containing protein [Polyangiaceae bacterium]|nr:SurA N-terminal domain-containing protein [Polyangiaceae bacterium]